ncbi:hypothetical protein V8G54_002075 [Vigna mungo]|uniref:Uncharacterized protein n=1 Tax=Vigna mungo TaxID=3915 RepID=A0AAQ3P7G1_VIGMU
MISLPRHEAVPRPLRSVLSHNLRPRNPPITGLYHTLLSLGLLLVLLPQLRLRRRSHRPPPVEEPSVGCAGTEKSRFRRRIRHHRRGTEAVAAAAIEQSSPNRTTQCNESHLSREESRFPDTSFMRDIP